MSQKPKKKKYVLIGANDSAKDTEKKSQPQEPSKKKINKNNNLELEKTESVETRVEGQLMTEPRKYLKVEEDRLQQKQEKSTELGNERNIFSSIEPANNFINESDSRKLKKYFVSIFQKADKVTIKYDTQKPMVIISYFLEGRNQVLPLRGLLQAHEELKKCKTLIENIYTSLYRRVDKQFYEIGIFGLDIAEKQKRVKFNFKSFQMNKNEKRFQIFLMYFAIDSNASINFILFDNYLNSIEFKSSDILKRVNNFPEEFKIFAKFESKQLGDIKTMQNSHQFFGQDQMDSDQEERQKRISSRKKTPLEEIKQKLKKLLDRDLSQLQDRIEEKNEHVMKANNADSDNVNEVELIAKLADEIMEEEQSLNNFKLIRDEINSKLEKKFENSVEEEKKIKMFLKQIIIAEKQLESKLPILTRKREIFEKLNKNNLLILEGQTGSGKSTQLPQLLCEYYKIFEKQNSLPVLITQPRKLATRTLAERVAAEMEQQVHQFVDYQTSLTTEVNKNAKIVFKMDRLVLDELKVDPILSKYCCLVIDEAHERTISIDVILGLIKLLLEKRKDFKIIVTSASMDTDLFKSYYKSEILKVSGRMYPVEEIFLPFEHEKDVNRKIENAINQYILEDSGQRINQRYKGHILVFCSSVDQITSLCNTFGRKLNERVFKVLPLHGRLTPQEQREVFYPCAQIKIIFATRIAETSITIDGIKVVIDPGEDRENVYDQKNKITSLKLKPISQSSAKQRAGRAGRTNTGFCFRLYSKKEKNLLTLNKTPQIQNMALDTVVLRLKSLGISDVISFPYISPPSRQGLVSSLEIMKMLGCLSPKEAKITPIGEFLLKLPIQPFLARAIIEAMLMQELVNKQKKLEKQLKMPLTERTKLINMNVTIEVVRILCMIVNASNLFYIKQNDREIAEKKKFENFADKEGDFYFFQKIYREFISIYDQKKPHDLRNWASRYFLSLKSLHQARELQREIMSTIRRFMVNIEDLYIEMETAKVKLISCNSAREVLLSCLVTSFSTNLCLYSNHDFIGYTLLSIEKPIQLYGTSTLSLQGISPKWILCYDLYENQKGQTYCKVAHSVDYKFLLDHVNPYIIKQFSIEKAENKNPYYESIVKNLPSLLFLQIQADYQRRLFDSTRLGFLQRFHVSFDEDLNRIVFSYLKKSFDPEVSTFPTLNNLRYKILTYFKQKNFRESKNPLEIIEGYLEQLSMKYNQGINYNYVGLIYIRLTDGFSLDQIDLKTIEHVYKVEATGQAAEWIHHYCSCFGTEEMYNDKLIYRIYDERELKDFERTLDEICKSLKESGIIVKRSHEIEDKRKKIPQAKLFMHFWAGESSRNNILLNYRTNENSRGNLQKYVSQMAQSIRKGQIKLNSQRKNHQLKSLQFVLTKKRDAINCYPKLGRECDEIELRNALQKYKDEHYFGYAFEMPKHIAKFREPSYPLCAKSYEEWAADIRKMLKKEGHNDEDLTIRVWGYYSKNKSDGPKTEIEKTFNLELHAEIKSYDLKKLKMFESQVNGKVGVIGTEKVHLSFEFEQVAVVTTQKVFLALEDEFQYILARVKGQFPSITVENHSRTYRNLTKVFIKIRGPKRDQLISPSITINKLFSPKIVKLEEAKFRFLDKSDEGNNILSDLEQEYGYKIYFAFQRKFHSIKLYCEDRLEVKIVNELEQRLKKFKYFSQCISYRGKNLTKVKELIDSKMEEIQENNFNHTKFLNYDVIFRLRQVKIIADIRTFGEIKQAIMKLVNKNKGECEVCLDLLQKPYRLYKCNHTFCWQCLASYIRETLSSQTKQLLNCPLECGSHISVYDIKRIMNEVEFNKLCDLQISRNVQKNPDYHCCFSPNCENIFETKGSKKRGNFECELCGKWYCFTCKQSHKSYTCDEWSNKLDDKSLEKLGIKRCPKCGTGIQKNAGCQHMTCTNCKIHICWNCMKCFTEPKPCYDHLAKQCGGIFRV